jgi:alpha-tubulin suppressor-like RCC1 family protein
MELEPVERILNLRLGPDDYVEVPARLLPPGSLWEAVLTDPDVTSLDFPTTVPTSTGKLKITPVVRNTVVRYLDQANGAPLPFYGMESENGIYLQSPNGSLQRRPIVGCDMVPYVPQSFAAILQPLTLQEMLEVKHLSLYLGFRDLDDLATLAIVTRYHCLTTEEQQEVLVAATELLPQVTELEDWLRPFPGTPIAAGSFNSFILTSKGELYTAGSNGSGQLGLGHNNKVFKFTQVPVPETISTITAGVTHSFILSDTGKLYAAGSTADGRLGLPLEVTDYNTFISVPTPNSVATVVAGTHTSFILTTSGKLYACGSNKRGELGLGHNRSQIGFTLVSIPETVLAIAAGDWHTLALTVSGKLYSCGSNDSGQLGQGDTTAKTIFTLVPLKERIIAITAGYGHSIALTVSGTVYVCGRNDAGQLGLGDTEQRNIFTPLPPLEGVVAVVAKGLHSFLLTASGKLYATGFNLFGQLGLQDKLDRTSFTLAPTPEPVAMVVGGDHHSLILAVSGQVYICGSNLEGHLGFDYEGYSTATFTPITL